jgi:hypothetical protein
LGKQLVDGFGYWMQDNKIGAQPPDVEVTYLISSLLMALGTGCRTTRSALGHLVKPVTSSQMLPCSAGSQQRVQYR